MSETTKRGDLYVFVFGRGDRDGCFAVLRFGKDRPAPGNSFLHSAERDARVIVGSFGNNEKSCGSGWHGGCFEFG
ncbi:hypothetical protein LOC51_22450 [Rubrivivax sp. JA1024]|nr:hypothetical protein [Rubrivivax sp. JA1024]